MQPGVRGVYNVIVKTFLNGGFTVNISFDGRVVVITGASVGIGRACAIRFAEGGARLALVDVNEAGLFQDRIF